MKGLGEKLVKDLREYCLTMANDPRFELLCDEIEKAYYIDWRQSKTTETREEAWNELCGFKRFKGTFVAMQIQAGDGKR